MRKAKPVYFYIFIGMVIGWVTALVSFIYVGGSNALWSLAVFGCVCMFLGCNHFYTKANNVYHAKSTDVKEKKSLLSKARIWEE